MLNSNTEVTTNPNSTEGLIPYLVSRKLLSEDQLKVIDYEINRSSENISQILVRLGFLSEAALRDAISETSGQDSIDLNTFTADAEALEKVPREFANRYSLLPLSWDQENLELTLAMDDPNNLLSQDKLAQILPPNSKLNIRLAAASDINKAIDQAYGYKLNIDGILQEIETGHIDLALIESDKGYSQPTVRLVDAIITDAVKREASDIHFEPEADFLRIRYRIDGVLRQIRVLHKSYWAAMVVRIKVVSQLNIAETRAPQDGRMSLTVRGNPVDFRVSVLPTVHGENVVMRVLDRKRRELSLDKIGVTSSQIEVLNNLMRRPEGIIVISGPTGSGKTTSLYAMLMNINTEAINIMTLEDPVELPIAMIRQTSISETTKINFADGVRSMMRQDPDVMLVGEIRDSETAIMSFRAAMTGHQVYTTLHTNSAIGVFPRLMDMNISSQILSGNIIGVVSQRLVRLLCENCKESIPVPEKYNQFIKSENIYKAKGCQACDFTGYKGRTGIYEIIEVNEEFDYAIAEGKNTLELKNIALKNGTIPLAQDGLDRVAQGITSIEEVARNTDLTYINK